MNAIQNFRHPTACEGSDCAIVQDVATDWFGDLTLSEASDEVASDPYGDRF